jgi:hypothetical protein
MARRSYVYRSIQDRGRDSLTAAIFIAFCALLAVLSGTASPVLAQGYNDPVYRATPVRSGGVLGFLFGDSGPQYRRRDPYESGETYHHSPAPRNGGGYRTVCVRLCDGYYWPLSHSTGREGLMRDAERCATSCETPAKLFYHYSSGNSENMIDFDGQPYSGLEHAFRYRTEYVADCKCKPDPWSEEAKREYARRAEIGLAENTADPVAEQPVAEAVTPAQGRTLVAPASSWQRPQRPQRRRVLENFNPFGRWFN